MNRYRILYALGPGDCVRAFLDWQSGQTTISETSLTFSGQLFDFCQANSIECWAISSNERTDIAAGGLFIVENRPKTPRGQVAGWRYHVRQLRYAISLLFSAIKFKADLAIVDSGTTHWFALTLFALFRIKTTSNFHNVYWPVGYPPASPIKKLIRLLDGWYFRHVSSGAIGVSPECERQVQQLAGRAFLFVQYRAQFFEREFLSLKAPNYSQRPFQVMFAGRIERNKGVFDLLDIAARLKSRKPHQVAFHLCGGGDAFDELKQQVVKRGLGDMVKLYGRLNRPDLLRVYEQSHLVIIPTRSDFCEGMPMVSAEAVLAGRPVLSSRLSNALDVLEGAILEARPEDIDDYTAQIEKIIDSRDSYEQCIAACKRARRQFIDHSYGKTIALGALLEALRPGWKMAEVRAHGQSGAATPDFGHPGHYREPKVKPGRKPLRILHAVGPGDVVDSFRYWQHNTHYHRETSIPYSAQFFSFCRDHGIETYVISSHPRIAVIRDGNFIIENKPKPGRASARGVQFHLREMAYGLSIILHGVRYRADIALIDSGTSHWFVFGLFRLFGIKPINDFHNAFWPAGFPVRKRSTKFLYWLNGLYLRWIGTVQIGVSQECRRQAEYLAGKPLMFFQYHAIYRTVPFEARTPPDFGRRPFRIVFAGRVERNKGVFDILSMAEKLNAIRPGEVVFEICGHGADFEQLSQERLRRGLDGCIVLHGKLTGLKLIETCQRSHLVIVPTTSKFSEAFAMVAAEAVLLGRPVLSNPVVPACEVLAAATVLARTDDVDDYVAKILELMSDAARYERLCSACEDLRGRFFDPANGIGEAVGKAIDFLRPGWRETAAIQSASGSAQITGAGNPAA